MKTENLLVICNNFPDKDNAHIGGIFVKEQINYLKKYFKKVYVISSVAYGMDYLRKRHHVDYSYENVHVYYPKYFNFPFFYSHGQNIWKIFQVRALDKLIKEEKLVFDLIHAHYTWPSGAVAVELKKKYDVPLIITEHTHVTLYRELKRKNKQYFNTWESCDAIIRVNKKDIPLLISHGVNPNKIFHIVNGFDPLKFKPISMDAARSELHLPINKKLLINISTLTDIKGQKYLITAIKNIVEKRKDVLCLIGGSGPLKEKLQKQIDDLNLQDFVKLIGFVPDNLLSIYMNACDIFVLPSLGEGNPTVMFEALGCNKPFIGTTVGGEPEIITSEDYGLLSEPADSEKLAENLLMAMDKEWDVKIIEAYAAQFTWDVISQEIINVYSKIDSIDVQ